MLAFKGDKMGYLNLCLISKFGPHNVLKIALLLKNSSIFLF